MPTCSGLQTSHIFEHLKKEEVVVDSGLWVVSGVLEIGS
jgi:hypothetical protein